MVSIKPIPTATVPVIKLKVDMSFFIPSVTARVDVDISFDWKATNASNGLTTLVMTKEMLKTHRHMQKLVLVIKHFLALNKLNSAY